MNIFNLRFAISYRLFVTENNTFSDARVIFVVGILHENLSKLHSIMSEIQHNFFLFCFCNHRWYLDRWVV